MDDYSKSRVVPRYPCTGPAEILHDGSLCWGRLSDISSRGCCVETLYPLPIGSDVQLRITVAGTVLDICAKVAWIVPQCVMAMSFENVSAQQGSQIESILEKVKSTAGSPTAKEVLPPDSGTEYARIMRAAELLAKITKRIHEKGVLTKQELLDMENANR